MSAILIRTVLFYIILSVLVRLMGKRQIGELQLPEFTAAILLSELAALPITDRDIPILHGILALAVVVSLEVIVSFICRKCPRIRKLLDGEPVFLIYKGEVLEHNLTRTRISLDEIFAQVRNDGYSDISEVEYVILEQTGKMSVLPKANTATVTPGDLALNKPETGMAHAVVIDGRMHEIFLRKANATPGDVTRILARAGVQLSDVLYLTLDESGKATLVLKEDRKGGVSRP